MHRLNVKPYVEQTDPPRPARETLPTMSIWLSGCASWGLTRMTFEERSNGANR